MHSLQAALLGWQALHSLAAPRVAARHRRARLASLMLPFSPRSSHAFDSRASREQCCWLEAASEEWLAVRDCRFIPFVENCE